MVRFPFPFDCGLNYANKLIVVEIAREDAKDAISERDLDLTTRELEKEAMRAIGNDFEGLWNKAQRV